MKKKLMLILTICCIGLVGYSFGNSVTNDSAQISNMDLQLGSWFVDVTMGVYPIIEYNNILYLPLTEEYLEALNLKVDKGQDNELSIVRKNNAIGINEVYVNANQKDFKGREVPITLLNNTVKLNGVSLNQLTDLPCFTFNEITYLPLDSRVIVDGLNLLTKSSDEILYVYSNDLETEGAMKSKYYINFSNALYKGEINSSLQRHGEGKTMFYENGAIQDGVYENGEFVKGSRYFDIDIFEQKDLNWKDRVWLGCPAVPSTVYVSERIDEINIEIEKLKTLVTQYDLILDSEGMDELHYGITGDVIAEDDEAIYLRGQAYGFGEGWLEYGIIKVMKPSDGTNFLGKYTGSHVYINDVLINGEIVKVYKTIPLSSEAQNAKNERYNALNKIDELQSELNEWSKEKSWKEDIYQIQLKDGTYVFYNVDGLFTVRTPNKGKLSSDGQIKYSSVDGLINIQYKVDQDPNEIYKDRKEDDEFVVVEISNLIDDSNGISNAFAMYCKNDFYYNYVWIYLISEENGSVVIIKGEYNSMTNEELIDDLIKIGESVIFYGSVG